MSIGGTEGGAFDQPIDSVAKNRLGGVPVSGLVVEAGGTVSGGTEVEVLRTSGANGIISTSFSSQGWRALPAGVYYITITGDIGGGSGDPTGLYSIEWEDLVDYS